MGDNSGIFITIWDCIVNTIGSVLGWFFEFLTTFGAVGLFVVAIVLYIFLSYVITGSNAGSDKVKTKKSNENE